MKYFWGLTDLNIIIHKKQLYYLTLSKLTHKGQPNIHCIRCIICKCIIYFSKRQIFNIFIDWTFIMVNWKQHCHQDFGLYFLPIAFEKKSFFIPDTFHRLLYAYIYSLEILVHGYLEYRLYMIHIHVQYTGWI